MEIGPVWLIFLRSISWFIDLFFFFLYLVLLLVWTYAITIFLMHSQVIKDTITKFMSIKSMFVLENFEGICQKIK